MTETPEQKLAQLRRGIDNVDAAFVYLLAERFRLTDQVGHLKAEHSFPAVDAAREERQAERVRMLCKDAGLDEGVAVRLLQQVISEVVKRHVATAQAHQSR